MVILPSCSRATQSSFGRRARRRAILPFVRRSQLCWHNQERMPLPDNIDLDKLAEVALALLSLTSFTDHGVPRAWKGLDWDVLDLLHERGWIQNPKGKARSVVFTELGQKLADEAVAKHLHKL